MAFPELTEGGGGEGMGVGGVRSELLQDSKVCLKTKYARWKIVVPNFAYDGLKCLSRRALTK